MPSPGELVLDRATHEDLVTASPPAWAGRMRSAFDVFEKLEMPTQADENWKYVTLDFDVHDLDLATEGGTPIPPGPFLSALPEAAARARIVDGRLVGIDASADVEMVGLTDLDPVEVAAMFDLVPTDHDVFSAARAAFSTGGVEVRLPRHRVLEHPVVIDVQATQAAASFPVISIRTGENSEGEFVVVYRSPEGVAALVSPHVGLHAGDGSRLRFLAVQDFAFETAAVIHQRAAVGRDASLRIGEVGLGGSLGRLDLGVLLEGAGSSSEVVGLSFGEHSQIRDYRMVITHRGRNTSSDVFLKGAVEDEAESVFTGLLRIEKDAVRSSAFETNRNLVLSEGAKAHSVPNLEILCDDVVCGHGSSVGPLDEQNLYYMQSRGLSRARAERLLIKGFFQEAIDRLPVPGLDEPIRSEVFSRFVEAQSSGRVAS